MLLPAIIIPLAGWGIHVCCILLAGRGKVLKLLLGSTMRKSKSCDSSQSVPHLSGFAIGVPSGVGDGGLGQKEW